MTTRPTCEEVLPLLAPYADDTLAGEDRARVAAHVLACVECRTVAGTGRQARRLLLSRAGELRTAAPDGLRRQVAGLAAAASPRSRGRGWTRWVPLSAAAALALAVAGVVLVGAFASRTTVLAAQLGLDHLKCLFLAERHVGSDPAALAAVWQRERGWAIEVPPSSPPDGLELVTLRRCLYGDGEMAHLVYEHRGEPVSLFILPRARDAAGELEIMGLGTVTWHRDGRTYALVGGLPMPDLATLADHMKPLAR